MDNESVGKKIVEALKRQAENNINDDYYIFIIFLYNYKS